MRGRSQFGCIVSISAVLALGACLGPPPVAARSLEEALASSFTVDRSGLAKLELSDQAQGLTTVFASSVAASFPVTGTSAPYVYRFDAASDSFQRLNIPLGPVFSERALTIGPEKLSVAVNYLLVQYNSINGTGLDAIVSQPPNQPNHIELCRNPTVPSTCVPVEGLVRLDLEAQIATLSATYGVTPDLDINVFLPLVRTFLRASTTYLGPDPRAHVSATPFVIPPTHESETSTGVGDLLLRLKYVLTRRAPVDLAAGLTVSLPTGSRADFQGTGDTQVGTALYTSRTFAERIEPHLNLGFVLNADKFDRSQTRYSVGADVRILDWLTLNNDFLGRSDITRPDTISRPVFVQIERADVLQFSTGLKASPFGHTALFFNALLPLNRDGVRADQVLAFGVESVF